MPGLPSVAASSQGWASVGSMWSTSLNEDWLPEWVVGSTGGFTVPCSPTSSGYIFTSTGDGTTGTGNSFYALGRAVRIVQGVSTIYGPVASASVAAGVTTVGLSSDLATAALSTATAFTSVAVGTESGHSLAGSSSLSGTLFHRDDGTWAAPSGGVNVTVATSTVASFTTTSSTYVDVTGLSISVTPASTTNNVEIFGWGPSISIDQVNWIARLRLWNNTDSVAITHAVHQDAAANQNHTWSVYQMTQLGSGAKTIRVQARTSAGTLSMAGGIEAGGDAPLQLTAKEYT